MSGLTAIKGEVRIAVSDFTFETMLSWRLRLGKEMKMLIRFVLVSFIAVTFVYAFAACYWLFFGRHPPEVSRIISVGLASFFVLHQFLLPFNEFLEQRKKEKK